MQDRNSKMGWPSILEKGLSIEQKLRLQSILVAVKSDSLFVGRTATPTEDINFVAFATVAAQYTNTLSPRFDIIQASDEATIDVSTILLSDADLDDESRLNSSMFQLNYDVNPGSDMLDLTLSPRPSWLIATTKNRLPRACKKQTRIKRKPTFKETWDLANDSMDHFMKNLKNGKVTRDQMAEQMREAFQQLRSFCTLSEKAWKSFDIVRAYTNKTSQLFEYAFVQQLEDVSGLLTSFLLNTWHKFLSMPTRISDEKKTWLQIKQVLQILLNPKTPDLQLLMLGILQGLQTDFTKSQVSMLMGAAETKMKETQRALFITAYRELDSFVKNLSNKLNDTPTF